ncbi:hypothetical protein GT037_008639 [Alternaria burnsii]|uniref:Uncharacterized protein n=1 Tax=Alternaria burnsii TaxID=1187904 RepID=A0A8H7B5T1_9PLEO|nr:uncharacterized protein GT037_008639 [Alternaria burnsii]KAF7673316.1 hypothetical protein GT037_008639 [Alternaria burnsii]
MRRTSDTHHLQLSRSTTISLASKNVTFETTNVPSSSVYLTYHQPKVLRMQLLSEDLNTATVWRRLQHAILTLGDRLVVGVKHIESCTDKLTSISELESCKSHDLAADMDTSWPSLGDVNPE